MDNTKTPPKTSITQRLRIDLGRSVEVTGVVKPGLKGTNLPTHRKSSLINRTWHDRNIVFKYLQTFTKMDSETLVYNLTLFK